jgi:hypothetical protein
VAENNFDPKVNFETCSQELCSFSGDCIFLPFYKQYYCDCYGARAGRNCSFANATELEYLQDLTLKNAMIYNDKVDGRYDK